LSGGASAAFGGFGGVFGDLGAAGALASALVVAGGASLALPFTETSPESVFTVICGPPFPILPLITELP